MPCVAQRAKHGQKAMSYVLIRLRYEWHAIDNQISRASSVVERRTENPCVPSSILGLGTTFKCSLLILCRGVAQLARVLGLGPRGRGFKSHHPDHFLKMGS